MPTIERTKPTLCALPTASSLEPTPSASCRWGGGGVREAARRGCMEPNREGVFFFRSRAADFGKWDGMGW